MFVFLGNLILVAALIVFIGGFLVAAIKEKKFIVYISSIIGILFFVIGFFLLN